MKLQNKKGDIISYMTSGIILVIIPPLIFFIFPINENRNNCSTMENLILMQVNGMKDMDTGFISEGTTKQKNLLFSNGLLVTLDDDEINKELYLNNSYTIKKCEVHYTCVIKTGMCKEQIKFEYILK